MVTVDVNGGLPTVCSIYNQLKLGPLVMYIDANNAFQCYPYTSTSPTSLVSLGCTNTRYVNDVYSDISPNLNSGCNPYGYWIVRNTWSTSWGINGYIYIAAGTGNKACAAEITGHILSVNVTKYG